MGASKNIDKFRCVVCMRLTTRKNFFRWEACRPFPFLKKIGHITRALCSFGQIIWRGLDLSERKHDSVENVPGIFFLL